MLESLIPSWDWIFRWSTIAAFALGGAGVTAAFISTWVGAKLGNESQKEFNLRLADANARVEEAKADAAKANERAAALEKEASAARLESEKIKRELSWRVIKPAAAEAMLQVIGEKEGCVNIRYSDGDPEALSLAMQYSELFLKAKWKIGFAGIRFVNTLKFGIIVPEPAVAGSELLKAALTAAGVEFSTEQLPRLGIETLVTTCPNAPTLFIGSKRPALP